MIEVRQLFVSAGHNFFGHHGQPPGHHPIREASRIECVAGCGIRGDRFFSFKENYKGQITFFSEEIFSALQRELDLPAAQASATRRNVLVAGADLNALIGAEFEIQGVRFAGVEECKPCYWMDSALGPGAEAWLRGRGGLRARILTNGILFPPSTNAVWRSGLTPQHNRLPKPEPIHPDHHLTPKCQPPHPPLKLCSCPPPRAAH